MVQLIQREGNVLHSKYRLSALILTVLIASATLFSEFYIASETDHHCSGSDCPVCRVLLLCHEFLNQLACTSAGISAAAVFFHAASVCRFHRHAACSNTTPVTLKVKLSC